MKKTTTLVALFAIAYLLAVVGCATKPKTNAQKCAAMGGVYTTATRTCQFQSE